MEFVAHRGYAAEFPENTLTAFSHASGTTADWIEFDVRRCGSGELVVFHDETLSRVTESEGAVSCTSWGNLRELDVLGSGEGIPRLEDALNAIPPEVGVQIELKERGIAGDIVDAIEGRENPAVLISFSLLALKELKDADPTVPAGYILHDAVYGDAPELGVETASHLGCEAVHMYYSIGTDPEVVEYAHDRELVVQTAAPERGPTDRVLDACRTAGVDRLSTNERVDQ